MEQRLTAAGLIASMHQERDHEFNTIQRRFGSTPRPAALVCEAYDTPQQYRQESPSVVKTAFLAALGLGLVYVLYKVGKPVLCLVCMVFMGWILSAYFGFRWF